MSHHLHSTSFTAALWLQQRKQDSAREKSKTMNNCLLP